MRTSFRHLFSRMTMGSWIGVVSNGSFHFYATVTSKISLQKEMINLHKGEKGFRKGEKRVETFK